jgi:Protein of unknown function (DUF732)
VDAPRIRRRHRLWRRHARPGRPATLQQQGIGFGTTQSAIGVAHHVCGALGQGMEPSDISEQLVSHNSHIDQQTALVITVDAAQSYCPQYVHHLSGGAVVVGPQR